MRLTVKHGAMLLSVCGAMGLTACGKKPLQIVPQLPQNLIEPCLGPDVSQAVTVQDMAKVSIDQEAGLVVCEAKRSALVKLIEGKK